SPAACSAGRPGACSASPCTATSLTTPRSVRAARPISTAPTANPDHQAGGHGTTEDPVDRRRLGPMSTDTTEPVTVPDAPSAPFGSVFGPVMSVARFDGTSWSAPEVADADS